MSKTVYFNGHNLSTNFYVHDLVRPAVPHKVTTHEVPGHDGLVYANTQLQALIITMTLTYINADSVTRRATLRELDSWLNVDEPKVLQFSDDGDLYYLAIPQNGGNTRERLNASSVMVEFLIPDPVMYKGASMATPSKSGNNYTFTGNYPCRPVLTITGAQPNASGYYGIKMDDSKIIDVPLTSGSHAVVIDCDVRTVTVDNANVIPTITSDWFVCTPGTHKIVKYLGSQTALAIAYWPRWL